MRLLLLMVAGFAAMVANWVRIFTLVLIGDRTAMEHSLIVDSHDGFTVPQSARTTPQTMRSPAPPIG